jgi:hypothetical protein
MIGQNAPFGYSNYSAAVINEEGIVLIRVYQTFICIKFMDISFYIFANGRVYDLLVGDLAKSMFPVFSNNSYKIISILRIIEIVKAVLFMFFVHRDRHLVNPKIKKIMDIVLLYL